MNLKNCFTLASLFLLFPWVADGQNPIIKDQFSADPTAKVFEGKIYLYPSHDIPAPADYPRKDWFCMEDYHVYSSENLTDWTDHGLLTSQNDIKWVNNKSYSMWAPDCVFKNGKYYFYFPSTPINGRGFAVGVGTAVKPEGPFTFEEKPIEGVTGIDPCVLMDDDGQSYIYWSGMGIRGAKLNDNMKELEGNAFTENEIKMPDGNIRKIKLAGQAMEGLPEGFKEGPYAFKANGKYYLTFPWVRKENGTETLAYAMSDKPLGPWTFKGIIMAEHENGCWTNHHSIINYKGQWYLFYHHNDYSPKFDKNRSARIDSLSFNPDGTIQEVIPTERGVGIQRYDKTIEMDRFSKKSDDAAIEYINRDIATLGWKIVFAKPNAWVTYNNVQFPDSKIGKLTLISRVKSANGGLLQVWYQTKSGRNILGEIKVPASTDWQDVTSTIKGAQGLQNLGVSMKQGSDIELDNITFSKK